jgi:hypothetical protein
MEKSETITLRATLSGVRFNQTDEGQATMIWKVAKQDAASVAALALYLPCNVAADVRVLETL